MAKNTCPSFDIKKLCYELYKNDWKRNHGITHDMQQDAVKNYYEEFYASSGEYSFEDYLRDYGFEGKIYACFNEFLDNEYVDEDYISGLLDNTNLVDLYLQDIHPIPEGLARKTLFFSKEEFKVLFEAVFGKYNVDVNENDSLYNEVNVEFYNTFEGDGIYFCAISVGDAYVRLSKVLGVNITNIHTNKDGVWVVYKENNSILVKTSHGVLSAVESPDPTYPGVDIELQPESLPEDYEGTLPRVLFEEVDGELRVLVWAKSDVEDCTHFIRFE